MKVGITGGIGSGKSTVCRLFARLGVAVYDSDAGAKRLMTEDAELRRRITDRFGAEAYADGTLNRTYLAGRVFSEAQALADLNAIVHPAVPGRFRGVGRTAGGRLRDPRKRPSFRCGVRCLRRPHGCRPRPRGAAHRTHLPPRRRTPGEVRLRIAAQTDDDTLSAKADYTLVNILESDLEPAVAELHRIFSHEAHEH